MRHVRRPVALLALVALAGCSNANAHSSGRSTPSNPPTRPVPSRAPTPSHAGPLGFLLVGDFGSQDAEEAAVAFAAQRWVRGRPFDGFVTLGDNVYETGDPSAFHAAWTVPYGWVDRAGVPVVVALGNHDVETAGGAPEIAFFHLPGHYYSRRIGPVEFFVLDANEPSDGGQMSWLESALASSTAPWKVVVFHQPAFSCGRHQSDPDVQRAWVSLFARDQVDLVVNGHDHDYQRFAPIDGVTYVVSGGGGQGLYPIGSCPAGTPNPVAANGTVREFLYLRATGHTLTGTAVSAAGAVIDRFTLPGR